MVDPRGIPALLDVPVLPLRSAVLFPHAALPIVVSQRQAVRTILGTGDGELMAVAALASEVDDPTIGDLCPIATLAIVHRIQLPQLEGAMPVVLDGIARIALGPELQHEPYLRARVTRADSVPPPFGDVTVPALRSNVLDVFAEVVANSPTLPDDLIAMCRNVPDADTLTDIVAAAAVDGATDRQQLLAELDVRRRLEILTEVLMRERETQKLRDKIRADVEVRIGSHQREVMLREQLAAIHKELGEGDDLDALRDKLDAAGLSVEADREAKRELARLGQMPPASPEYTVARTYLETLADLPWSVTRARPVALATAAAILDEDHFGLDKVKQRILEHLAVHKLRDELSGPILCLVGPPGVGKTSIGRSIARATGRAFVRLSLGGIHDEAEIRGHRRTYVGALPGQILRGLRRAGSRDPLFVLDEIDKLGRDIHGDPQAALLEALDREQNSTFRDNYLDVAFDLSRVLFVCTANILDPVPPALRDRMEVLELPGYVDDDKLEIATRFLVPRAASANGVSSDDLELTPEALFAIIRDYTHEPGVRKLEEHIAAICRKRARQIAEGASGRIAITPAQLPELLGIARYRIESQLDERTKDPGVALALAWTPAGGELLFVEASRVPGGKGNVTMTGQLGDVMQESAKTALTWVRANAAVYGVDAGVFAHEDIHVHVPSGAVAKDGPSAGVVMVVALVSLFTGRPVRSHVAMTGEITLSGHLLPIGGLKEKVLAARRSGITEVVIPAGNEPDLREIPAHLLGELRVRFATTVDDALRIAL